MNRGEDAQHLVENVDPFTGKLQLHQIDLYLPGNGGLDIKVQRSYSSVNELLGEPSPAGVGWTMHFGRILHKANVSVCAVGQGTTFNPVLELPDGSRQIMYEGLDGSSRMTTALWRATCNPLGGLTVNSPDGTTYDMTTPGPVVGIDPNKFQGTWYTTKITDRNGNTLDFTYTPMTGSGAFGVQSIAASDGRSVTFNYSGDVISSVSSGSATWSYSLTPIPGITPTQYTLDTVTRPDGTTWRYEYNPAGSGPGVAPAGGFSMRKVTYPTGGMIDYTYGFVTFSANPSIPVSTVVTQKTTLEGSWTYTYTPATAVLPASGGIVTYTIDPSGSSNLDKTSVTGPEGTTAYFHIGYASAESGTVYLVGTLAGKAMTSAAGGQSFVTQIESYGWIPSLISNQNNIRPGTGVTFDPQTFTPIIADKKISRNGLIYETAMSNFDGFDNPQTITESGTDSRTTTLTYFTDPIKWIIHQKKDETISTIGAISRTFDGNGNLMLEDKYGVQTGYSYTGEGDIASKTDAAGHSTTYGGYFRGIPQSEGQPEGVTISRTVSNEGNIVSQTDGEEAMTGYTYDGLNRLTSIHHPTGNAVSITWDSNHRTVTRGGYSEVSTFDGFGRQVQDVHSDSLAGQTVTQTFAYDTLGRRTFASYPNESVGTGFIYDMAGELLAVINGNSPAGSGTSERTFTYQDSTVQMTNERGFSYTYTYRAYGDPDQRDLLSIAAPLGSASVLIGRNGLGQMTDVTQDGVTRSYEYDGRYYLTSMTEPEVGTTTFGRDAVGNMTSRQVGGSATTAFTYDGRNRVTAIGYPAGTPSVTRTYYRDDKLKTSDNGVAHHAYSYDQNKNLTQETLTIGTQAPFVIGYSYDGNDALDVLTYGSGTTITYSPSGFGWPTRAAPYIAGVTHHPNGQIASISYANGVQTTIGLNARQWPNTMLVTGLSSIFNTLYSYDEAGNVLGIQDALDPSYNRGLDYDPIDRLTTANGSWGTGSIAYNGHGDITSQQLGTASSLTYAYDGQRRLQSVAGSRNHTYSYDAYGNVTGNGQDTFTYNDASNMKCSNCGVSGEVDSDYDAGNMRVRSTTGGASTYFVYGANGNLLWEQIPGTSLTEYVYLQGKQVAIRKHNGS